MRMTELRRETIRARIKYGWSKRKAETTPLQHTREIKDKCIEYGIKYSTVLTRMINQDMSLEEALTRPTCRYMWNGRPLTEQVSKVEYQRILVRLRAGWDYEEAVTTPSLGSGHRRIKKTEEE